MRAVGVVEGGGAALPVEGEDGEDRLDGACRAEEVAGHALGRGHGHLGGGVAHHALDGGELDDVGHGAGGEEVMDGKKSLNLAM